MASDIQRLQAALKNADAAGDTVAAQKLASAIRQALAAGPQKGDRNAEGATWRGDKWVPAGEPLFDLEEGRDAAVRQVVRDRGVFKGPLGAPRAFLQGAQQGGQASFGDEVTGALVPGLDASEADQYFAQAWEDQPWAYGAGYAGGSVIGAPGLAARGAAAAVGGAARAAGRLAGPASRTVQNVVRGAAGGAAGGAVDRAGYENAPDLGGRAASAGEGAAWGAAIGGALPVGGKIAEGVASVIPGVRTLLPQRGQLGVRMLTRALVDDGVDPQQANTLAVDWLARGAGRTAGGQRPPANNLSAATRRMERAGQSPPTLIDLANQRGWTNTQRLLDQIATQGGPGARTLEAASRERMGERADRTLARLDTLGGRVGARGASAQGAEEVIGDVARQQARANYANLPNEPIRLTGQLRGIVDSGAFQEGVEEVVAAARAGDIDQALAQRVLQHVTQNPQTGRFSVVDNAPADVWQELMFGMRNTIANSRRTGMSGGPDPRPIHSQRIRTRTQRLRNLVSALRAQSPALRTGDAAYAMDMGALEAVDHGRHVLNVGAQGHNAWVTDLQQMTPPEIEAAQEAAREAIVTLASQSRSAFANRVRPGSNNFDPQLRTRLRALFGQDVDDTIAGFLDEAQRAEAGHAVAGRGAQTARRLAGAEQEAEEVAADSIELGTQALANPPGFVATLLRKMAQTRTKLTPAERQLVAQMATPPWAPEIRMRLEQALQLDNRLRNAPGRTQGRAAPLLSPRKERRALPPPAVTGR